MHGLVFLRCAHVGKLPGEGEVQLFQTLKLRFIVVGLHIKSLGLYNTV